MIDVFEQIKASIINCKPIAISDIQRTTKLKTELEFDSLYYVMLLVELELAFNIEFHEDELGLDEDMDVGRIEEIIKNKLIMNSSI